MGTICAVPKRQGAGGFPAARHNGPPLGAKVVRSGMGSHFRLPILNWGIEALEALLGDMRVYYADMNGETNYWQAEFKVKTALLIGGEADGASEQGRALANTTVSIPMAGGTESLNAAVSAALLMFEVARQRQV